MKQLRTVTHHLLDDKELIIQTFDDLSIETNTTIFNPTYSIVDNVLVVDSIHEVDSLTLFTDDTILETSNTNSITIPETEEGLYTLEIHFQNYYTAYTIDFEHQVNIPEDIVTHFSSLEYWNNDIGMEHLEDELSGIILHTNYSTFEIVNTEDNHLSIRLRTGDVPDSGDRPRAFTNPMKYKLLVNGEVYDLVEVPDSIVKVNNLGGAFIGTYQTTKPIPTGIITISMSCSVSWGFVEYFELLQVDEIIEIPKTYHSALHPNKICEIWRTGRNKYVTTGDVSINSPNDYQRIVNSADKAVSNSSNDRFTNYDVSQGLNAPITELNSPWIPENEKHYPARRKWIDDKEPRPNINGKDYHAQSIYDAAFMYFTTGNEKYLTSVKTELLWYANNEWLDFTNTKRWLRTGKGFADRNPGFFISCWLNSMIGAFDFVKDGLEDKDIEVITTWFTGALDFYHTLINVNLYAPLPKRDVDDYSLFGTGGWFDTLRGAAWENSEYEAYGFNEYYANRRTVQVRFITRCAALLYSLEIQQDKCIQVLLDSYRYYCEWIAYGNFENGMGADMHRGGVNNPQQGLQYSWIGLGAIIDIVYTLYVFKTRYSLNIENPYEVIITKDKYFSAMSDAPWHNSFAGDKNLWMILKAHLGFYNNEYRADVVKWGNNPINGYCPTTNHYIKVTEMDRCAAVANIYYKSDIIANIYRRLLPTTKEYVSSPSKIGSYDQNLGVWSSWNGVLYQFDLFANEFQT